MSMSPLEAGLISCCVSHTQIPLFTQTARYINALRLSMGEQDGQFNKMIVYLKKTITKEKIELKWLLHLCEKGTVVGFEWSIAYISICVAVFKFNDAYIEITK
jgi:hypothetical protein